MIDNNDPTQARYLEILNALTSAKIQVDDHTISALAWILVTESIEARFKLKKFQASLEKMWRHQLKLKKAGLLTQSPMQGPKVEASVEPIVIPDEQKP